MTSRPFAALLMAALAACDTSSSIRAAGVPPVDSVAMRARQDSAVRSRPGYIVDSILPVEEGIRRFQAASGGRPKAFAGGATSRAALVRAFMRALERRDTTALGQLVVSRAEFGALVYPVSPNARPPYRQSPEIVWLQRSAATDKGARRLLARFGGRPVGYRDVTCPDAGDRQGPNTVWSGCVVRLAAPGNGDSTTLRMFGPIVHHGGRFKFLSLSNGL